MKRKDRPKLRRNRERTELRNAIKYQPKLRKPQPVNKPHCHDCGHVFAIGDYANQCEGCSQLVCDRCKAGGKHKCLTLLGELEGNAADNDAE